MYFNSNGEKVSRARWKEMYNAFKNRQELVKAGLTSRRDLMKMGLLTSAGMLIAKTGLSSRAWADTWGSGSCYSGSSGCGTCASPTTRPWVMNMPVPTVKQPIALSALTGPAPTIAPNNSINPATGIAYEGRTRAHQSPIGGNGVSGKSAGGKRKHVTRPAHAEAMDLRWHESWADVRESLRHADPDPQL